jgi:flavin-dependent dehydrogenase
MKIAIMGAGLSGLACAITLEKHGIEPAIFEKRSRAGDRFVNGEVLLSMLVHPVRDCIASLSDKYGVYLQPTAPIQKLAIHSQHETAVMEGPLGFINIRGRQEESFEAQLERQVQSKISFDSDLTYEDLVKEYTHVILATGDADHAKRNRNFREDLTVSISGATVEGRFDRFEVQTWLDYAIAPYGYGYLIPYSESEANVVVALPDQPGIEGREDDLLRIWDAIYEKVQGKLGQKLRVTDSFQIRRYPMGICESARVGNTFYVGNNFGSMMPFLGFGQYNALLTGVYAAYDLCGLGSYEQLSEPLRKSYEHSLVLRRAMENVADEGLDRIVHLLSGRLGDKLFLANALNPLKLASYLLRPYIKWKQGTTT